MKAHYTKRTTSIILATITLVWLSVYPAYVMAKTGKFTSFDPPGSISTFPIGINPAGTITGNYADASLVVHGFLRNPKGLITTIDVPGACETSNGTFATGINPAGVVTGSYHDATCIHFHGFLRTPDGIFTTIDAPGSTDTAASGINPAGAITGNYVDASGVIHGFLWTP